MHEERNMAPSVEDAHFTNTHTRERSSHYKSNRIISIIDMPNASPLHQHQRERKLNKCKQRSFA